MCDDDTGDIHLHCLGCIKFTKCTAKPEKNISCEIISCELGCGMKFHGCKKKEHRLLCANEKVPCYNAESGCPCTMQRRYLPKHLITCPASVVHCTMEWNRWYIDLSTEEKLQWCTDALQNNQPHFDVALALRDLRILRRWYTSCKNEKNTLRNHFRTYPLPLRVSSPSIIEQHKLESPCGNDSLQQLVAHPGLQSSVCNQLYYAGDNNSDCLIVNGQVCDNQLMLDHPDVLSNPVEGKEEHLMNYLRSIKCSCNECDCACSKANSLENGRNEGVPFYGKNEEEKVISEHTIWLKDNAQMTCFNESIVNAILSYPTRYLGLGPRLESVLCLPRHTINTFLCAEEFRRDEYPWHYKNVHSEIYGGLNGWLQERCPLAQYGCTFSRQRLHPTPKGSKIVYNQILESFGIAQTSDAEVVENGIEDNNLCNGEIKHQGILISQLPFEVLQHIARFLDSFSLSNLALTSCLMREVCQSLLVERGIVTLRWERQNKSNTSSWHVTQKRWSYSSHFTPVRQWTFSDDSAMANHLKTCKFFKRNLKTEPHYHPMGAPRNSAVYERLKKASDSSCCENLTTKL